MKIKLLSVLLILSVSSHSQITKAETFLKGTKITFYANECGNNIPEADGKLTFCDGNGALGVVERNYGLNDRAVERMLPNYFNNDEVFVTRAGLSIRNTDGSWENVPNISVPTFNTQSDWTNAATIKNGLVLPDGKIIIQSAGASYATYIYDRSMQTITEVDFPTGRFPYLCAYDTDRNLTWIVAFGGGATGRYLYTLSGSTLTSVQELTAAANVASNVESSTLIYYDNHLYLGSFNGLFKIDITDYTTPNIVTTEYNSSTTPSLPFDRTLDLQFDTNGDLWLAQSSVPTDGGLVKFNITDETYELYQLESSNPALNYAFDNIAVDEVGTVWAAATNYSGMIELTFPAGVPTWNELPTVDLDGLNVPMTYRPENIYFRNNKFYFTTIDFSSGQNFNYEVVINDDDSWSGRNDDEPGNLSFYMSNRFTNCQPDGIGGVWWFNSFDGIIVYRDSSDNHQTIFLDNIGFEAAIDDDNKAIVRSGNPNRLRKIDFPNALDIQVGNSAATVLQSVSGKVLVFDRSEKKVDVYKDDSLFDTYNLEEDWYTNSFYFAAGSDGFLWNMRYNVGDLEIKSYDTNGGTITTYSRPESLSTLRKIVAAPNGIWFIGTLGAIYYEAGTFYAFLAADYTEIYNLQDGIVDDNGKLYLLNNDSASITTIENPTDANPTLTNFRLEGANAVLPALGHYRPDAITLDSEGSLWSHATQNAFKLIDTDFTSEYIPEDNLTLSLLEQNLASSLSLSPNPTKGNIQIETSHDFVGVEIYNILGALVKELPFTSSIDIEDLQTGIYLLKLKSETVSITKKIIKE